MRRVYIDPWRDNTRTRQFTQNIRTEMPYYVDFSAAATDRGTSVSSVEWKSTGSRSATIASEALASGVASATVESNWGGYTEIRVEATYANGDTESVYLDIMFKDPEYR